MVEQLDITFQLVPPYDHRRNLAEIGVQTQKNRLTEGLSVTEPSIPHMLWHTSIKQATITINLLRNSRVNTSLSGYAQILVNSIAMLPLSFHQAANV